MTHSYLEACNAYATSTVIARLVKMDKKLSIPARVVVKAHIAFGIVAIFQQKLKWLVQVKRFFRLVGYGPQPC